MSIRRKKITTAILLMALLFCGLFVPDKVLAADSNFTIKEGVMTKYNGSGGNVVIPDGVTVIGDVSGKTKGSTGITVTIRPQDSSRILTAGAAQAAGTAKWIDAVKLPGYAKKFYQVLEESTDNDGKKDYLIKDKYFKPGNAKSSLPKNPKLYQVTRTKTETSMLVAKFSGKRADAVSKNIRTAFDLFVFDHPEVFWLYGDNDLWLAPITRTSQGKSVSYLRLDLRRFGTSSFDIRKGYTQKTIRSNISKMNKQIKQIKAGMPDGGVYKKVQYFNNWLTMHNDRNNVTDAKEIPDRSWRSISALVGSTGKKGPVCLGYTFALKVLCDQAKIPCMAVAKADLSAYHTWNYVQIGKLWYAVDVTRNDPVVVDQNGNRQTKANSGYETEDYLLVGTDTKDSSGKVFKETHSVEGLKHALPASMTLSKEQYTGSQAKLPNIEDYVSGFYEMLKKSTDGNGIDDYLINDEYFTVGSEELPTKDAKLYQVVHASDKACMLVGKAPGDKDSIQAACRRMAKVYNYFGIDHPEVFWLCNWSDAKFVSVTSEESGQKISYIFLILKSFGNDPFDMRGDYTEKSIRADISRLEQSVKNILSEMPDGSIAEKVRYFNHWLTKHNDYCTAEVDKIVPLFSSRSISALFGSTGVEGPVCTGYAGAFKVLCDRAGIPCLFAVGKMETVYHAWNYVLIGQLWYAVDVTWNDPAVADQNGNRLIMQADSGYEKEEYLLAGSETKNSKGESFAESHMMQDTQLEHYVSEFAPQAEWSNSAYAD